MNESLVLAIGLAYASGMMTGVYVGAVLFTYGWFSGWLYRALIQLAG